MHPDLLIEMRTIIGALKYLENIYYTKMMSFYKAIAFKECSS